MTRTIAMIAVAGIAGSAFGQGFALSASSNSVNPGDSVTITMSYNDGARVLAGGVFDFTASGGAATAGAWLVPLSFGNVGVVNGGSIEGARYTQFPTPGTNLLAIDASGDLFQYSWSAAAEGVYTIDLSGLNVFTGTLTEVGTAATQASGRVTIEVIPTPASAAVLGLGGLAAARRRR